MPTAGFALRGPGGVPAQCLYEPQRPQSPQRHSTVLQTVNRCDMAARLTVSTNTLSNRPVGSAGRKSFQGGNLCLLCALCGELSGMGNQAARRTKALRESILKNEPISSVRAVGIGISRSRAACDLRGVKRCKAGSRLSVVAFVREAGRFGRER